MFFKKKTVDPKKQFSKWLARFGAWMWGIYLLVVAVLIYFRPEAAMPCVYLVIIVTLNKMLDTIQYTDNSKTEKILLAGLDKLQMELSLKGLASTTATSHPGSEASDAEDESENG